MYDTLWLANYEDFPIHTYICISYNVLVPAPWWLRSAGWLAVVDAGMPRQHQVTPMETQLQ